MDDLDLKLVKFYHQVIEAEIKQIPSVVNKESLRRIRQWYRKETVKPGSSIINFDSLSMRCAYVYNYGPCFTSSVTYHFKQLLQNNYFLLQKILLRRVITICCLGGGPGIEVVGITKVLEEMIRTYYPRYMKLNITIVDKDGGWRVTAVKVVQSLSQFVDASLMELNFSFLQQDLTEPLTDDVKNALIKSDIVTMVNFVSAICDKTDNDNNIKVMQEIFRGMKQDGILFFQDFPGFELHNSFREVINCFKSMIQIYGPQHYDIHRLSVLCMRECLRLYSKYYGWRYCSSETINCVGAWYKKTWKD